MKDTDLQKCIAAVLRVVMESHDPDDLKKQMEQQGHRDLNQMAEVRAEFMLPRLTAAERSAVEDRIGGLLDRIESVHRCADYDWDRKERLQAKMIDAARKNAETILNLFETCYLDRATLCPICKKRYGYRTPFCPRCNEAANRKVREDVILREKGL